MSGRKTSTRDSRLFGIWKSDRERTFSRWKPRPGSKPHVIRKFKSIFGQLEVRWTEKRCYSDYQTSKDFEPYRVIDKDSSSVVVRVGTESLWQLRFEEEQGEQFYWLAFGAGLCEWFRKIR